MYMGSGGGKVVIKQKKERKKAEKMCANKVGKIKCSLV